MRIIHEGESFNRCLVFWKTNAADIPPGSKGAEYVAILQAVYNGLVKSGALQKGISVSAKNALIMALENDLDALATTAEAITQDMPGFDDLFPRCKHLRPGEVMSTANMYLENLEPLATDASDVAAAKTARVQKFTDNGVAATFVTDLRAQVDAIGLAVETQEESREQGVASTKAIDDLVKNGQKQRNYLNAIAVNLYKSAPDKFAAWASASHVEAEAHHAKAAPTTGTTANPSTTQPSATK